jgi:hypothetical protein
MCKINKFPSVLLCLPGPAFEMNSSANDKERKQE